MLGNFPEESTESRLAVSRPEVSEVTPEQRTEAAPEKTEAEQLAEIGVAADSEFSTFETLGQRNLEETVKTGSDLGFSASEVETRLDLTGARTTLDRIKNAAADAYRNFKKILTVGAGAAILTAAPEAQPRFVPEETLGPGLAQEQVLEQKVSAISPKREEAMPEKRGLDGSIIRPHPELAKDNPQRVAYEDYEEYKKYVESMRDVGAEERGQKEQEYWDAKRKEYLDRAQFAEKYNWEDLRQKWIGLAISATEQKYKAMGQNPRSLYESAKSVSEPAFKDESGIVGQAFRFADEQRGWVAGVAHSDAYAEKAKSFESLTQEDIDKRKGISIKKDVEIADSFHSLAPGQLGVYRMSKGQPEFGHAPGGYTVNRFNQAMGEPITVHELTHAMTDGGENISDHAKKLYAESYIGPDVSTEDGKYLSKPTELDARKRVFEYELETNGIWQYGQPFTADHLAKALQLQKEGKFSQDAIDFLANLKPDKIPEIMNTIAENRSVPGPREERA